jgi:hypothetical protein
MAQYEYIGMQAHGFGQFELILIACKPWLDEVEAGADHQAVLIIWIDYQDKCHYEKDPAQDEDRELVQKTAETSAFFH